MTVYRVAPESTHQESGHDPLRALLDDLLQLKQRTVTGTEREAASLALENTSEERIASILNLLNYIVIRREDLRPLQTRLANTGLSSLGRLESHVLSNLDRVIDILSRASLHHSWKQDHPVRGMDYVEGPRLLRRRAERIFGKERPSRCEYIMVTMPTEAAENPQLVSELIDSGMDTARINCAHDDEPTWQAMIENIRRAARQKNTECRILMDLAGHKIRTLEITNLKALRDKRAGKSKRRIHRGDWLILSKKGQSPEQICARFEVPVSAVMTCSHPEIVNQLQTGETIWIDDGKIGTLIHQKLDDAVLLQANRVGPKGAHIKTEKGLNFPETRLELPSLSAQDERDLAFVARHADMVGLSYTEQAEDILYLYQKLSGLNAGNLPIIAKVETAHAVKYLPDIISRTLAANIELGIMIARGDLAIELGSVRMAEIQEEILWLCEAAHIPVIWATQVLESLAKKGVASRSEITDAAMAVRAECVMLNKGPYIQHAVSILSDVLQRMEAHQFKKISRLRALHW